MYNKVLDKVLGTSKNKKLRQKGKPYLKKVDSKAKTHVFAWKTWIDKEKMVCGS